MDKHYTIEAYFTKLVESVGDKYPNLTVENLLKANSKLKNIQKYMLLNYTDTPSHWFDLNDNMVTFKELSDWVDKLKKNYTIHSVYYCNDGGTPYFEAYERKPRSLETVVGSYTKLNNELIKEAMTLVNKEIPTQEIKNEYDNITKELSRLTKKVTEMRDKYIL